VWCTQSGVSDFSPFTVGNPLNNLAEMQHPTNGLRTFPNPSGGSFTILLPAHFRKNTTLTMTDAQGRVVFQEEVNSEEIQLNQNLSEGLYLLKCLNAEGRVIQKRHLITF
jgi:hypothetical protein